MIVTGFGFWELSLRPRLTESADIACTIECSARVVIDGQDTAILAGS
jgi:hypothetical protein